MKLSKSLKIIAFAIISLVGVSSLSLAPAYAAPPSEDTSTTIPKICSDENVPDEVKYANGCGNSDTEGSFPELLEGILNGIIGAAGVVAVIFIVIGGIQYITSTGEAAKVQKAKMTILYAAIGLAICVLSFAIVNWVILNALKQ